MKSSGQKSKQPTGKPFLVIQTEQEGVANAINLTDRAIHYVYRTIRLRSTHSAVENGKLFTINSPIDGSDFLEKEHVIHALRYLTKNKMVTELALLQYNIAIKKIEMVPVFLAHHEADSKSPLEEIYNTVISYSIKSIESSIKNLSDLDEPGLKSEYESECNEHEKPDFISNSGTLFHPFQCMKPALLEVSPHPEMMAHILSDLKREVTTKGIVLEVPEFGYIPVKNDIEILKRYEAALELLHTKVIPMYSGINNLKSKITKIDIEEAEYRLDEISMDTSRFAVEKARVIKDNSRLLFKEGSRWYPGQYSVETIIAIGSHVENSLIERKKNEFNEGVNRFKESIIIESTSGGGAKFISLSEYLRIPHPLISKIDDDSEILKGKWETSEITNFYYIPASPELISKIVKNLSAGRSLQSWKYCAVIRIIENNSNIIKPLLMKQSFKNDWEKLQWKAYKSYSPWYYQIFAFIPFVKILAVNKARTGILMEQDSLHSVNERKKEYIEKEIKEEKKERKQKIHENILSDRVKESIENFYFYQNTIPTLADIEDSITDLLPEKIHNILDSERYQLLSMDKKRGTNADKIVLFPLNQNWRSYVIKIYKMLEVIFQNEPEGSVLNERAKFIQKCIASFDNSSSKNFDGKSQDPYKRLKSEIDKSNKK